MEPQPSGERDLSSAQLANLFDRVRRWRAGRAWGGWEVWVPLLIVGVVALLSMNAHFNGVDWGDDFALYMRQARALTIGNIGEVIHANRFTVDNSGWHSFSPYAYPWGWPLIVAPFYVVFGLDYSVFKLLEVAALCGFLLVLFGLVRRRAGGRAAVIITLLLGLSPIFVGATDSVLSDLPYLCFVGLTLWWLDRCRLRGMLTAEPWMLVVLGVFLAYTFNVRREGISVVVSVVALHAAVIGKVAIKDGVRRLRETVPWKQVALPYASFAVTAATFHLLLPTMLLPKAPGTGLSNISARLKYYEGSLAEQVGLKDAGAHMQLFHSEMWARRAIALLVLLAVIGLFARLVLKFEEDIALAAYVCTAGGIMLISPFQEPRYLYSITPLVVYFAYQALPSNAALMGWRTQTIRRVALAPAVAIAFLVVSNGRDLKHSIDYHRDYQYTVNGPESPDAKAMLAKVQELTRGDDIILFFRARAMTLYTDRLAVQGSDLDLMLKRVDWYVMQKNSTYSQTPLTDAEGAARQLTKTWENGTWVVWRVPPRAA